MCLELDGTVWRINEGPMPTTDTHPNCHCTRDLVHTGKREITSEFADDTIFDLSTMPDEIKNERDIVNDIFNQAVNSGGIGGRAGRIAKEKKYRKEFWLLRRWLRQIDDIERRAQRINDFSILNTGSYGKLVNRYLLRRKKLPLRWRLRLRKEFIIRQ